MAEPFRVLFVCTANICRSPAAEYIARQQIGEQHHLFRSAGFLFDGRNMTDPMQAELTGRGVVGVSEHRSHIVDADTLHAADLILTMESAHLQDLVVKDRRYFHKTIPLREAAERLTSPMSAGDFGRALADRDASSYLDGRWDVADPYKRSTKHYREAAELITGLITTVFTGLETPMVDADGPRPPLFGD